MSEASACPVNLGPREVRRRAVPGAVMVAVGAGLAAAAVLLQWGWVPRLLVLAPLGLGFLNLLQASAKT